MARAFGLLIASLVAMLLSELPSAAHTNANVRPPAAGAGLGLSPWLVQIAQPTSRATSPLAGRYVRIENSGAIQSAEITVVPVIGRAHAYAISGQALWGNSSAGGPHDGDLHFVAKLIGNILRHTSRGDVGRYYEISIRRAEPVSS